MSDHEPLDPDLTKRTPDRPFNWQDDEGVREYFLLGDAPTPARIPAWVWSLLFLIAVVGIIAIWEAS